LKWPRLGAPRKEEGVLSRFENQGGMRRLVTAAIAFALLLSCIAASSAPDVATYAEFTAGVQPQRGLFPIWRKGNKVYLELSAAQLDRDFVETIVPGNGLAGNTIVWGDTDHLPAMLVRFHRVGDQIAIIWPNTYAVAPASQSAEAAIERNFPQSVVGLANIAAVDSTNGTVIFDASVLLNDVIDMNNIFRTYLGTDESTSYQLDLDRTYFGEAKAFPLNDLIAVDQTWRTYAPHVADTAPDARSVQMRVVYNFAQPPGDPDYRPRYADDRVGIYDAIYLNFARDEVRERQLRYIVRWNIQPSDPSKKISPSKHPLVFYLSNTIPPQYRGPIREAVLKWNDAFLKLGISDAIQVRDQPNDPSWDPDDIRYNVLRWVTEAQASFGADSQTLYDPRTGQEFRTGILISADSPRYTALEWKYVVDPVRYGRDTDPVPRWFIRDAFLAEIMHETGHNLGMQHNFIGHAAYSAQDLRNPNFTRRFGVTSTVMEYAPVNVWPQPFPQGDYYQTTLGPYDYYAMRYAYGPIPGARTPDDELPTLRRWASQWSNPLYRYASDEDVSWQNGHASDPRVATGLLTNDPMAWCQVRLGMDASLMRSTGNRLPAMGEPYETARDAFVWYLRDYLRCAGMPVDYLGGQYISRAHRGDPGAQPAIVPVPRSVQLRAFQMLDKYLFSASAWNFSPKLLQSLGYSEWAGYGYTSWTGYGNLPTWAYNPPERHDYPIVQRINDAQAQVIDQALQPLVLQRIDENPLAAIAPTMTMEDLFAWMQHAIYGDISPGVSSIPLVTRNLQILYAGRLVSLVQNPAKGVPSDAQALARFELHSLQKEISRALSGRAMDLTTRAHLENLVQRIKNV
jgi:hypothetical protein